MRCSAGRNFELAWSVVDRTKSRIACLAGPSFHEPNGPPCSVWVCAVAENGRPDNAGSNARPESITRRLMSDHELPDFMLTSFDFCTVSFNAKARADCLCKSGR